MEIATEPPCVRGHTLAQQFEAELLSYMTPSEDRASGNTTDKSQDQPKNIHACLPVYKCLGDSPWSLAITWDSIGGPLWTLFFRNEPTSFPNGSYFLVTLRIKNHTEHSCAYSEVALQYWGAHSQQWVSITVNNHCLSETATETFSYKRQPSAHPLVLPILPDRMDSTDSLLSKTNSNGFRSEPGH